MLLRKGKRVVPVHPWMTDVLGLPTYKSLAEIPHPVDVVDVFRRSDEAGRFADEAVAIGAKGVWFQLEIVDEEAYARTVAAGLDMVMNRCPAIEWPRTM
jgi:predicted CoA-binding protein